MLGQMVESIIVCVEKMWIFKSTRKQQAFLPIPRCLTGGVQSIPFVLIRDDAFTLKPKMMKLNSQQNSTTEKGVNNYRHSRGRRILGNLFGILATR